MNTPRKQGIAATRRSSASVLVHVLQRQHSGGEQPPWRGLAELGDPVVICPSERVRRCPDRRSGGSPRRTRSDTGTPGRRPSHPYRSRACGSDAPSFIGWRWVGSSAPISSQVIPGRQIAWRGMFGFIVSRKTLPLILRYEPCCPLGATGPFCPACGIPVEILLPYFRRFDDVANRCRTPQSVSSGSLSWHASYHARPTHRPRAPPSPLPRLATSRAARFRLPGRG